MPDKPETLIEDLKQIAAYLGISVKEARREVWKRSSDPLPVKRFMGRYLAWPSALDAWKDRHTLPVQVAKQLEDASEMARKSPPEPAPSAAPPENKDANGTPGAPQGSC